MTETKKKKISDDKKIFPAYIPIKTFEKFKAINEAYGISNNAVINILIKDYVTEKQKVLEDN
jgi:5,10-methylenetetrahydrofolate reductase